MKKNKYLLICIVIILLATNPNFTDFKNHVPDIAPDEIRWEKANLFICSVYNHDGDTYLGLLGNFFEL